MSGWRKRLARLRRRLLGAPPPAPVIDAVALSLAADRYFPLGPDLALARIRSGEVLYVDPQDEHISHNIIVHGFWEADTHAVVMRLLRPGARVIEVGANLGYYTVTMANRVGPAGFVTALEANPRLVGLIQRSLRFNGLTERAAVVAKAALDQPGEITFVVSRSNSGGGYVSIWDHMPYDDGRKLTVETVRLDDLGETQVDMIRIDAEGSEAFILKGAEALLRRNPDIVVCMEWSRVQIASRTSVPDFIDWMVALGFRFWRIDVQAQLKPITPESLPGLDHCDIVAARRLPPGA